MPFTGFRRRNSIKQPFADGAPSDRDEADDAAKMDKIRPATANVQHYPDSSDPGDDGEGSSPSLGFPSAIGLSPPPQHPYGLSKNRHSSDPELGARYRQGQRSPSPEPHPEGAPAPVIGITSPSRDRVPKPKSKLAFLPVSSHAKTTRSTSYNNSYEQTLKSHDVGSLLTTDAGNGDTSLEMSPRPSASSYKDSPPPYSKTSLTVPSRSRKSESSASDRTSEYGATMTTTHTISTTTTFFKLPKKKAKKPKDSLFPLPAKTSRPSNGESSISNGRLSASDQPVVSSPASDRPTASGNVGELSPQATIRAVPSPEASSRDITVATSPSALASPAGALTRNDSGVSARSTPNINLAPLQESRPRSQTSASFSGAQLPPLTDSGRNSTSTTVGRNSLGAIRTLTARLRNPSEQQSPRHGSPSGMFSSSKNNSFALSRETLVVPDREEGETAGRYYARLERQIPKKGIAMALSKSNDQFSKDVLRSLLRSFKFYEEPMDIALRRFLWEIDLPGEAQQIDRVMSAFAERYHECNPHIFFDMDQVFFVAYSLIILHSDLFNKNNKRKMQRSEYQKNTGDHGIDDEILGYFYDNIQYTEFIAQDADDDESGTIPKATARKAKRVKTRVATAEPLKTSKLDPYDFVVDHKLKLDILRPSLKDTLNLDDTYSYLGTAERLDIARLRAAFFRSGVLQVVSARSRPEAFRSPSTINNPNEAHPGVVDIKVAKVGVLWRKDAKKKKTRSPWQEWGAILTSSQLYFFRNVSWVKSLASQYESHRKHGNKFAPVIFKPPVEDFKPDFSLRTFNAIALQDVSYRRHKHAFLLARHDEHFEETVLAEDEHEMNDWLAKINYSAVFTTTNINIQPLPSKIAGSIISNQLPVAEQQTLAADFATETSSEQKSDEQLADLILDARKKAIVARIAAAEKSLEDARHHLENHLRTARHLQILAPFPPRTRGDLLSFGARIAHKVRWARYEIWQSKCQKDVLTKEIDENENPDREVEEQDMSRALSPILSTGRLKALSRLNSKASALVSPQRNATKSGKVSPYLSPISATNAPLDPGISAGIDEAFATPTDMLSKSTSGSDGPFKLPPLSLGSNVMGMGSGSQVVAEPSESAMPHQSSMSSMGNSKESHAASSTSSLRQFVTPTPSLHDGVTESGGEQKPEAVAESDKEHTPVHASPNSRSNVRRSFHRTLRDSRESGSMRSRSKRGKGSISAAAGENPLAPNEVETLPRGSGSFKVHGKKASIITLPSDWQHIPAEERLRARKPQQPTEEELARRQHHGLRDAPWRRSVSSAATESSHPDTGEEDETARSSSTTAPEATPTPPITFYRDESEGEGAATVKRKDET